jgi:hypothetical protein
MSEYTEHKAVANYLKMQYPNVIFTSDSSGIRLSIGNAKKMLALKSNNKIPDLIILHPNQEYNGLIIEIKAKHKSPYLKNGSLSKSVHIQEQNKTLEALTELKYKAVFGVGFDECKNIIDKYMNKS